MLSESKQRPLLLVLYLAFVLAILVFGAGLRIQFANARVMHADEAVQAYQLAELMETGEYQYDPVDKHGPTLYYFSWVLNRLAGIDAENLNDANVRLIPVLASLCLILLLLIWNRRCDLVLLVSAFFFACFAFPVIYGSYYVQESLFALFGFLTLYFFSKYWFKPSYYHALGVGIGSGLLFATKETAVIHLFCILGAARFAHWKAGVNVDVRGRFHLPYLLVGMVAFLLIWALFFSSFLTHFRGLEDSIRSLFFYLERAEGQGHEKPWSYYVSLFLPHVSEGASWGESAFLVIAVIGLFFAIFRKAENERERSYQLIVVYGVACLIVYSLIPYKTPWLMLTTYTSLCVAAGYLIIVFVGLSRHKWQVLVISLLSMFFFCDQLLLTLQAKRYAADSRNPYIYQHTSSQYAKLIERLEQLDALDPETPLKIAAVGDDAAWPLAWYWRSSDTVGYWAEDDIFPALDIVIKPSKDEEAKSERLESTHIIEYHGLRPNVVLECWIEKSLWKRFLDTR